LKLAAVFADDFSSVANRKKLACVARFRIESETSRLDSEHLQDFANWLRSRRFVKSGKAQESGLCNSFPLYCQEPWLLKKKIKIISKTKPKKLEKFQ
jgi:hypothetical protein